jgi:hypothetical protein
MSVFDLLKRHGAEFNGDKLIISCRDIVKVLDEYSRDGISAELQDILDRASSKAYLPTILKERIKRYRK